MRNNVFTPVFIKREQNHRWRLCKQWIYKCYEVYKKRLDVRKTTRCNYFLIKLANFALIVVWRFTLFLPFAWVQRSTSGNPACSDPTAIPRESNTVYHSKRHQLCRRGNINILLILQIRESKKLNLLFEAIQKRNRNHVTTKVIFLNE